MIHHIPTDYSDSDFWTEARCISQRACLLNVVLNPAQFPKANPDSLWRQIEDLECHMLTAFATVRTARVLCGMEG